MDYNDPFSNEIFTKIIEDIGLTIKRYEKYDDELRFTMLADKLILSITFIKTAIMMSMQDQIRRINDDKEISQEQKDEKSKLIVISCDKISGILNLIKNEFNKLDDFIRSDSKTTLKNIENKLDEVLLGPDYNNGKEMMNIAKIHYDSIKK